MDYTTLATAVLAEVGLALTAVIPVIAVVFGATVGYKLFKRFAR